MKLSLHKQLKFIVSNEIEAEIKVSPQREAQDKMDSLTYSIKPFKKS